MLRSHLCDFSDAYIVVKGTITVTDPDSDAYDKNLAFKNTASIISGISKINNTQCRRFTHCNAYVQFV